METGPPCRATTILPVRLPATRFPRPSSIASPNVTSPRRRGRPTWPVPGASSRFAAGDSAFSASAVGRTGIPADLRLPASRSGLAGGGGPSRHRAGRGVPTVQGVRTRRLRDRDRQRRRARRAFEALRRAAERGPERGGAAGALPPRRWPTCWRPPGRWRSNGPGRFSTSGCRKGCPEEVLTSTVTSRGRVTIPREIRDALGWKGGQRALSFDCVRAASWR